MANILVYALAHEGQINKNSKGAISLAVAATIVVYSIAPARPRRSRTDATVDCFCPIAT